MMWVLKSCMRVVKRWLAICPRVILEYPWHCSRAVPLVRSHLCCVAIHISNYTRFSVIIIIQYVKQQLYNVIEYYILYTSIHEKFWGMYVCKFCWCHKSSSFAILFLEHLLPIKLLLILCTFLYHAW